MNTHRQLDSYHPLFCGKIVSTLWMGLLPMSPQRVGVFPRRVYFGVRLCVRPDFHSGRAQIFPLFVRSSSSILHPLSLSVTHSLVYRSQVHSSLRIISCKQPLLNHRLSSHEDVRCLRSVPVCFHVVCISVCVCACVRYQSANFPPFCEKYFIHSSSTLTFSHVAGPLNPTPLLSGQQP